MRKNKVFYWVLTCLCCGILFAGCGKEKNTDAPVQTVLYQNEDFGYQIEIPENWQVQASEDKRQISAVSAENNLALNIICELGGFNYYTPQDLAMTIAEKTTASFQNVSVILDKEVSTFAQSYRVAVSGENEEGIHTIVDVTLLQPIEGIHYYFIFSGGIDEYQAFLPQWEKMLSSFAVTKTPEEMYQKLLVE